MHIWALGFLHSKPLNLEESGPVGGRRKGAAVAAAAAVPLACAAARSAIGRPLRRKHRRGPPAVLRPGRSLKPLRVTAFATPLAASSEGP
jgi:hypothetical protein